MRILLVKTSSLGDVVHNLPVASDIRQHFPTARIDWAVEESFAEIPRLHPAVTTVVVVAPRRWRKSLLHGDTRSEIAALRAQLNDGAYDFVIDTQGLIKSALIARLAPGRRIGLDWISSREPLRLFYHRTYRVPWGQHAVQRNRQLAGLALGYEPAQAADYGIRVPRAVSRTRLGRPAAREGIRSIAARYQRNRQALARTPMGQAGRSPASPRAAQCAALGKRARAAAQRITSPPCSSWRMCRRAWI